MEISERLIWPASSAL